MGFISFSKNWNSLTNYVEGFNPYELSLVFFFFAFSPAKSSCRVKSSSESHCHRRIITCFRECLVLRASGVVGGVLVTTELRSRWWCWRSWWSCGARSRWCWRSRWCLIVELSIFLAIEKLSRLYHPVTETTTVAKPSYRIGNSCIVPCTSYCRREYLLLPRLYQERELDLTVSIIAPQFRLGHYPLLLSLSTKPNSPAFKSTTFAP